MLDADLRGLTPAQQVTYWVGAIAQLDTMIESRLRILLRTLHGHVSEPIDDEPTKSFEKLRDAVKAAVREYCADSQTTADVISALGDLKAVHAERVSLVHDLWAQVEGTETFVVAHMLQGRFDESEGVPRPVDDFRGAVFRQLVLDYRLHFSTWAISTASRIPLYRDLDPSLASRLERELEAARAGARGEFEIDASGGFRFNHSSMQEAFFSA